jgi:type IV pilus assembly protein PilN
VIKINLIPTRAAKKKENIRQQISIAVISLLFALIAIGLLQVSLLKKIGKAEDEITTISKDMESMKVKAEEIKKLKEKKDIFEKKFNIIKALRENKTGPVHLLDDLSRSIPGFLWITSFAQKEKTGEIELKGKAFSNEVIAQFMDNLEKSLYFANVNLMVSQQAEQRKGPRGTPPKNPELREFTITCQFEMPKGT